MFRQVGELARWGRGRRCAFECALLGALLCAVVPAARAADDPKAASAELSNQAFALLNSLNAGGADPLLGQVAGFAGDAQTRSQALSAGDKGGAGRAMASLESDAASLDAALKAHSGAINSDRWKALKQQLAALQKSFPAAPVSAAPPPTASGDSTGASAAPPGTLPGTAYTPAPASGGASMAPAASPPAA